jgi:hypothetical protein
MREGGAINVQTTEHGTRPIFDYPTGSIVAKAFVGKLLKMFLQHGRLCLAAPHDPDWRSAETERLTELALHIPSISIPK